MSFESILVVAVFLSACLLVAAMTMPAEAFVFDGKKWNVNSVNFHYNPTGMPANLNVSDSLNAIRSASISWSTVRANWHVGFGGYTDAVPVNSSIDPLPCDGINVVAWGDLGPFGSAPLANTAVVRDVISGVIVEVDTTLNNNTSIAWSTAVTVPSKSYDLESVAIHEFGHWIRLEDLGGGDSVMKGIILAGEVRRSLSPDDIEGVKAVYGARPLPPPRPGRGGGGRALPL